MGNSLLARCVSELIETGRLNRGQSSRIENRLRMLRRENGRNTNLSPNEIENLSNGQLLSELRQSTESEIRRQANQLERVRNGLEALDHPNGPDFGLYQQLVFTTRRRGQDLPDLETYVQTVNGQLKAPLAEFASRFRTNIFGSINNDGEWKDIGRALFNERIENRELARFADVIRGIYDTGLNRLNSAGLNISRLDNFGLPQKWDTNAVRGLDPDYDIARVNFQNMVIPRLDRARMVDDFGGRLDDTALRELVGDSFDTIVTGGANKRELDIGGRRAGTNRSRFEAQRILHFDNYDNWYETFSRLGSQNIPDLLIGHINDMSREIALVEKFGPFYRNTFNILDSNVERRIAEGQRRRQSSIFAANREIFDQITGDGEIISNPGFANLARGLRSFTITSRLGSAFLSSFTDNAAARKQANLIGSSFGRIFGEWFRGTFTPLDRTARSELATHLGFGLHYETLNNSRIAASITSDRSANEIGNRFINFLDAGANATLNLSGLNRTTRVFKDTVGLEVSRYIASLRNNSFGELPQRLRNYFDLFMINEQEWNTLRQATTAYSNVNYVDISKISDNKIIGNFNGLINAIRLRSVPEGNATTRAVFAKGPRGSAGGEALRASGQFASYGITSLINLIDEFKFGEGNKYFRAANYVVASFIGGLVVAGLKDVTRGRIPEDFSNPDFLIKGFQEAATFGIFGDLIFDLANRRAPSIFSDGPVISLANAAISLLWNTGTDIATGDGFSRRETINFLQNNSPGQLWYTRLLMERLIFDKLRDVNDPKQVQAWQRLESRFQNAGTPYYWAPNTPIPGSAN